MYKGSVAVDLTLFEGILMRGSFVIMREGGWVVWSVRNKMLCDGVHDKAACVVARVEGMWSNFHRYGGKSGQDIFTDSYLVVNVSQKPIRGGGLSLTPMQLLMFKLGKVDFAAVVHNQDGVVMVSTIDFRVCSNDVNVDEAEA